MVQTLHRASIGLIARFALLLLAIGLLHAVAARAYKSLLANARISL